jgi:hypothetical protein
MAWRAGATFWNRWNQWALPRRVSGTTAGVLVVDQCDDPVDPSLVALVEEALILIEACDPRRARRLAHDLRAIALLHIGKSNGAYVLGSRTCYINPTVLPDYSVANVAILIVHEATHARLDGLRLVLWWPRLRYRMEHRCLREELSLAALIPRDRFPMIDEWTAERAATSEYRTPFSRRRAGGSRPAA